MRTIRATIVIPTYWGRISSEPLNLEDAVYDHPTPLDSEGTLDRALESIAVISNRDFNVVVLAASTSGDIADIVEEKVDGIAGRFKSYFPVTCVSHSFEGRLKSRLGLDGDLVSLTGYSNIRNMCLVVAELARSEVAVLFDDDEVYEDQEYLDKVFEDIDSQYEGKPVRAVAGYYKRPEGGYFLPSPEDWWMSEWPMVDAMNEAFGIIGEGPRLKKTPFVFGGNMVVHRDIFRKVPFDPNVRRGEDIDYLVNCKFFDVDFLLDNQLSILHLPPSSHVPPWQHFRENIFRFVYAREKLRGQKQVEGVRKVEPAELEPYPGQCMGEDLEDLAFKTSILMGLHYLEREEKDWFRECMRNIHIARFEARPEHDPFDWYMEYRERWESMMRRIGSDDNLSREFLDTM